MLFKVCENWCIFPSKSQSFKFSNQRLRLISSYYRPYIYTYIHLKLKYNFCLPKIGMLRQVEMLSLYSRPTDEHEHEHELEHEHKIVSSTFIKMSRSGSGLMLASFSLLSNSASISADFHELKLGQIS